MAKEKKLTFKEQVRAILAVGTTTYKLAPIAVVMQIAGSIITAVLPLVTTYFAALTTTALASAYAGNQAAGNEAILYVIITALLGVVITGWRSFENYLGQLMRYKVEASMTDRMYEHFLRLDFWRYDDKSTADMYDKARRFAQFFPYIFDRLGGVMTQFITMLAGIGALFLVSWWLGVLAVIAILPGVAIQFRLSRLQAEHWKKNVAERRTVTRIEWSIMEPQFMAELRLYGVVRHLLDLRIRLRDGDEKRRIDFERSFIIKRLGADILEAAIEVIALVWVTLQIINRAQPIGQFIYVQQVVSRAIGGASGFVNGLSSIDEDLANLYDYQKFMALPEYTVGRKALKDAPKTIVCDHVSFQYPGAKNTVLHDINMTIADKQHVAIVGENGAGKSTLIKLLTGLYEPTKGSIKLDGVDLAQLDIASWHRQLGVLQQEFIRYGFATVRENIYYGDTSKSLDKSRLDHALVNAEAHEFIDKLPRGLDNFVDQWMEDDDGNKGQDLSGGQWQRLALARNFYRDSPIIILDEPTSAIDALAEARIFKRLFGEKNKTIITISHRLTTIEKADVVYMLKDGRIVEQGTTQELIARKGEFFTMFESQIKSV